MNRKLLITITVITLLIHIGMLIYFFQRPKTTEIKILISLLIFATLQGIVQLIHLIKKEDLNCVSPI